MADIISLFEWRLTRPRKPVKRFVRRNRDIPVLRPPYLRVVK